MRNHQRKRYGGVSCIALMMAVAASIWGCDGTSESRPGEVHFLAEVSGAVTGQVAGPGLVRFVPPSEASFGPRPGYYFVADDAGVRPLGVTFTIPDRTGPGTYPLESAHPMDIGKHFEVRVDRSMGERTESFRRSTTGTITIDAFPQEGAEAGRVAGRFDFSTHNGTGDEITVKGSFDFQGG